MSSPGPILHRLDHGLRRWEARVPAGEFTRRFFTATGAARWLHERGWTLPGFPAGARVQSLPGSARARERLTPLADALAVRDSTCRDLAHRIRQLQATVG